MYPEEVAKYIEQHTTPESPLLHTLNRSTHLRTLYPRMLSGRVMGRYLALTSKMLRPKRILEVGTFTGYSALCLAEGLADDGILHTIDINPELEDANRDLFRAAGLGHAIVQHIGDALSVIPKLGMQFDMVFLDANKEAYPAYFELLLRHMVSGGFLLADNVLWGGKVVESAADESDRDTRGIALFNNMVKDSEAVENVMVPIRDGVMLIRKK